MENQVIFVARIMCRELAVSHPCGLVIDTEHVSGLHVQSGMCLNACAVHRSIQIYKKADFGLRHDEEKKAERVEKGRQKEQRGITHFVS